MGLMTGAAMCQLEDEACIDSGGGGGGGAAVVGGGGGGGGGGTGFACSGGRRVSFAILGSVFKRDGILEFFKLVFQQGFFNALAKVSYRSYHVEVGGRL